MGSKTKEKSQYLEQMLIKQVSLAHLFIMNIILLLEILAPHLFLLT